MLSGCYLTLYKWNTTACTAMSGFLCPTLCMWDSSLFVICGNSLFPWNILLCDYITISSTVDGHLVCLQFCTVTSGAVTNITAICFLVNMHVHFCLLCAKEWNYWVIKHAYVQLWWILQTVSKVFVPIYTHSSSIWVFQWHYSSPTFSNEPLFHFTGECVGSW